MKLENGEISSSQLMLLVLSFSQSMILTINFSYYVTKHDTWIAVLAGLAAALLITLIYLAIARKFPGKGLVQINDMVYGPFFGKLMSVLLIWFFFQYAIHYMYFFNSFWITFIMPETPRIVFLIMFVSVCAMAVRGGIEVIARCSFLFVVITTVSVLATTALLLKDMNFSNLLPVFDIPLKDFIHSVHIIVAIPFCDIVVFLMIIPFTSNNRQVKKPVMLGIILSAVQLLIVTLRDAAVMGPRLGIMASASFSVTRQIDIANILTRLDILEAIILLITIYMKVTVFYYVTVLGIAQTLKLRSYIPLIIPAGIVSIVVASKLYPSDMEQIYAGTNVWPVYTVPFEILIPIITLIVAVIRRLPRKKGVG